jgi:hypothetical protein
MQTNTVQHETLSVSNDNTRPLPLVAITLLLLSLVGSATTGFAQEEVATRALGTSAHESADALQPATQLPTVHPHRVFPRSGYSTGGVSLRNRGAGGIAISGVIAPVKAAYLYWAVITPAAPTKAVSSIYIEREYPAPETAPLILAGVPVGAGPPPCWKGAVITVFEAPIPLGIAVGNGLYNVQLLPGTGAAVSGSDPWLTPPAPVLFEGASIVMVGAGAGTVSLYDIGLAGSTFAANLGLAYPLALPVPTPGVRTLFDNIGADGQHGGPPKTRSSIASISDEMTIINGIHFAGPGSPYNDSDWNGSSGFPVTELWDDTGHDITPATPPGTLGLSVFFFNGGVAPGDCLTPVANVVEED